MKKNKIYILIFLALLFSACLRVTGSGGVSTKTTKTYTLGGEFSQGDSVYAIFTGTEINRSTDYGKITINGNVSRNLLGPQIIEKTETRIDIGNKLRDNLKGIDLKEEFSKSLTSQNIGISKSYTINSEISFNIEVTQNDTSSFPSYSETKSAILVGINENSSKKLYIWLDKDYTNVNQNKDEAIALGEQFFNGTNNEAIYHWITNIFGEEWGTHGYSNLIGTSNSIHILLTELNTKYDSSNRGFVMGYFNPADTFSKTTISKSNEKNMFYMDIKLLMGEFKNTSTEPTAEKKLEMKKDIYSTLAHEFVHMINWYQKDIKQLKLSSFTEVWLNEMLAMIGEDLVDDKITVNEIKGIDGSKMRIPSFNQIYNNLDINDKDGSFDIGDYAINGVYGLYLTRAYAYNNLNFLRNIMYNSHKGTGAIDFALSELGSKKTFVDTVKDFGKSVILSSHQGAGDAIYYMNRPIDSYSHSGINYNFESINLFSTELNKNNPFKYLATTNGFRGGANTYAELRNSTDTNTSEKWSFTVPIGVDVQFIVKNSSGNFNLNKTSQLNNSVVIN